MKKPELIIFAKEPVPGQVKTRLVPPYTPEEAAEITAFLVNATLEKAVSSWPGDVYLHAWPDPDSQFFRELAAKYHIQLDRQAEGDLGEKMLAALRAGIARRGSAAVMGCDIPHCRWEAIDQAYDWLAHGYSVIGPTEDGGYYFIGLQEAAPELFRDIHWGQEDVFSTTIARAISLGIDFKIMPQLRDLDGAEDIWLVAQQYEPLKRFIK